MKPQTIFAALILVTLSSVAAFAQGAKAPSGPLTIRDADQPARQPFYKSVANTGFLETVPEGKVLVIEFVTGRVGLAPSGTGELIIWTNNAGEVEMYNVLPPTFRKEGDGSITSYYTHPVKLYIPAGRAVMIGFTGDAAFSNMLASVSGHYVDVP
jgi:hypothetical protein